MSKIFLYITIATFLILSESKDQAKKKKAMVLGFDGVDPVTFQRLREEQKLPNFEKFNIKKAYAGGVEGTPTSQQLDSGPGWTTILTGSWANIHHAYSNGLTLSKKVPTVFQHIKQANPDANLFAFCGWENLYFKIFKKLNSILSNTMLGNSDQDNGLFVKTTLESHNPDFIFAQFDDIDDKGHEYCHSKEYDDAMMNADDILGQIMETLARREEKYPDEEWLVLIVTDHGRDGEGCTHGHRPQRQTEKQIFIGSNLDIMNDEFNKMLLSANQSFNNLYSYPAQISITPTVLKYMNIPQTESNTFEGIPLIGKLGIQKLIKHEHKLLWSFDHSQYNEQGNAVNVFCDDEYVETIDIQQQEWPISELAKQKWKKGKNFTFERNGVYVTYRNRYYIPYLSDVLDKIFH